MKVENESEWKNICNHLSISLYRIHEKDSR